MTVSLKQRLKQKELFPHWDGKLKEGEGLSASSFFWLVVMLGIALVWLRPLLFENQQQTYETDLETMQYVQTYGIGAAASGTPAASTVQVMSRKYETPTASPDVSPTPTYHNSTTSEARTAEPTVIPVEYMLLTVTVVTGWNMTATAVANELLATPTAEGIYYWVNGCCMMEWDGHGWVLVPTPVP